MSTREQLRIVQGKLERRREPITRKPGKSQKTDAKGYSTYQNFFSEEEVEEGGAIISVPETEEDFELREDTRREKVFRLLQEEERLREALEKEEEENEEEERKEREQREAIEALEDSERERRREMLPEEDEKVNWLPIGLAKEDGFNKREFMEFVRIQGGEREKRIGKKKIFEKMNDFMFMVTNSRTAQPVVFIMESRKQNRMMLKYPKKETLDAWFKNVWYDKKKVLKGWQEWKGQRSVHEILFDPRQKPGFVGDILNEWEGFPYYKGFYSQILNLPYAQKENVVETLKHHVEDIMCRGESKVSDFLIKWMAWVRQHPGEKSEVVPIVVGPQGSGKTMMIQTFVSLFGQAGIYLSNHKDLFSQFNSSAIENKIMIGCDEVNFCDPQIMNELKNLVTSHEIRSEQKFKEMQMVPNYLNFFFSANLQKLLILLEMGLNRRWFIFPCSDTYTGNKPYFQMLVDMFFEGPDTQTNRCILDDWLSHVDLRGFNVRDSPLTDFMLDMIVQRLDHLEKWWYEKLIAGKHCQGPCDGTGEFDHFQLTWLIEPVSIQSLYATFSHEVPKAQLSLNDFTKNFAKIVSWIPGDRFPLYQECKRWADMIGGKQEVVKVQNKRSLTVEEAQETRKKRAKKGSNNPPGTASIRNFFSNLTPS